MKGHKLAGQLILIIMVGVIPLALGYPQHPESQELPAIECGDCHTCKAPTSEDPCLKSCPRSIMAHQTVKHELFEAPDSILLGDLADQYQPVHFDHKLHAEMAEMGSECSTCHHYSPQGHIPPCRECHNGKPPLIDLPRPGLKVAYHRQCLSCHREWSHEAKCSICHSPRVTDDVSSRDVEDSTGISIVVVPIIKSYITPEDSLPVVTFQHIEHIELFEFTCKNCHRQEKCTFCHDRERPAQLDKSHEEIHAMCSHCHEMQDECPEEDCIKCHDTEERPPLFHSIIGQTLPPYCQRLGCTGCHPEVHQ